MATLICKKCGKFRERPSKRAKLCYDCRLKFKHKLGAKKGNMPAMYFKRLMA